MLQIIGVVLLVNNALALYSSHGNVVELNPGNFDLLVTQSDEVWVVEFFAPWCVHCKNLVPEYTKAATALKGIVKVGAVDADQHKDLGSRFGARGFPTIKIFGANKKTPEDFNGARTAKGIAEAALVACKSRVKEALGSGTSSGSDETNNKDVVELTDDNFDRLVLQSEDMWLVEFYAPWCGHCKNLAPHWAKAATELKGKVKLGALDATVHQVKSSKYGIQGFPTIKVFAPGPKTADSVSEFDGGRTSSSIVQWVLERLAENIPAPQVIQITDEDSFKENCNQKPLCVVAVLPHILDCQSECRNQYLKVLASQGEKFKQKMWGWVWSEAGAQAHLEIALEIGGFGYPAMTVVNTKKLKFSVLRGSFSDDGIYEFLRDLSYGKGSSATLTEVPKISQVPAWDGQDGELPPEEDIDLSDVDLDEKDEL